MRLIPPHPWNTQDSHSHTSPLMKTPPHQKVQNCYWNYLMTDLKIWRFWCPSRRSHHYHQWSRWMSPGINSGRNGAFADERIANRIVRMDMSRPPFSRVPHRYRFTRGVSKTGPAGAGTVLNFGIPRCHGYSRVLVSFYIYIFLFLFLYILFRSRRC